MLLTEPPFVNADTTRRSPSVWLPLNGVLPPGDVQPTLSCRNQKPTLPSPALEFLSMEK